MPGQFSDDAMRRIAKAVMRSEYQNVVEPLRRRERRVIRDSIPPGTGIAYGAAVGSNANTTFTTGVSSKVLTWLKGDLDPNGFVDLTNSRFVIPVGFDGVYVITTSLEWDFNATGQRQVSLAKNGTVFCSNSIPHDDGSIQAICHASTACPCVGNDVIEVFGKQDSGGNLAAYMRFTSLRRIGSIPDGT